MIKVDPIKTVGTTKVSRNRKAGSTSSFTLDFNSPVDENQNLTATSSVDALSSLMDLQEIPDQKAQKRQLQERGEFFLKQLDQLRDDILMSSVSVSRLRQIDQNLKENRQMFDGSPLANVVLEIEQRIAIELAKLDVATKEKNLL